MILLQIYLVDSWVRIESLGPRHRHQFYQVVISHTVLGQNHKMSSGVALAGVLGHCGFAHIHLTAEYRDELALLSFINLGLYLGYPGCICLVVGIQFLQFFVKSLYGSVGSGILLVYIVEEFLYAKHISVVGKGNAFHAIGYSLVNQGRNRCLAIEN